MLLVVQVYTRSKIVFALQPKVEAGWPKVSGNTLSLNNVFRCCLFRFKNTTPNSDGNRNSHTDF
ncbi:hypothetical protein NBRC116495_26760 [Aurantivibrio plasticivorans]